MMLRQSLRMLLLWVLTSCNTSESPSVDHLVKLEQEAWLKGTVSQTDRKEINHIVIFGDSLSDVGRLHARTLLFYPPDIYWRSRASNGPLWIDYVAAATGWKTSNSAVAGAATSSNSWFLSFFVPSLEQQVNSFLADQDGQDASRKLIVIWIGPNNYLSNSRKARVEDTIQDIGKAVAELRKGGFKHFMIGTMPELGGLPIHQRASARSHDERLRAFTRAHNKALKDWIENLKQRDSTGAYALFQAFEINQQTIDRPSDYGFRNITEACYRGDLRGNFEGTEAFCKEPGAFKFWDGVHPNSKMHCLYAVQFLSDLQAEGMIKTFQQTNAINRCRKL